MLPLRRSHQLSVRTPCLIGLVAVLLTGLAASPASAQSGVIAFRDDCTGRLYAMRGDGSARIALPLPPLPQPTAEHRYWDPWILDVTTNGPLNGPLTVVYYVGISRLNQKTFTLADFGLFAVQLDDVGGALRPDPGSPVRLTLHADVGFVGVNPNTARRGSFAPFGDRLALVASSQAASVLMTAKVDRDGSKVTGLSDLVVVGDLYSLGLPDPTVPASKGFTGDVDYSPDGSSIVASIYYDLWLIQLSSENTNGGTDLLTANTDGFAEWKPAYSPEGTRIAYTTGPIAASTGGVSTTDIHSLTLNTRAVTPVTTNKNKGKAALFRQNAMWRADGTAIGFSAFTSATPRSLPCSTLVNGDLFLINADGSSSAAQITNTNGTSVEAWPKWGW